MKSGDARIMKRLSELHVSAEMAGRAIDEWSELLRQAIADPGDGEILCLYGRVLTMGTILASLPTHQDVWTEDRTRNVLELLVRAAETAARIKSEYYRNCKDRPRDFVDGLRVAYEDDIEMLRVIDKVAAEYQSDIDRGVPIYRIC